MNQLNRVFDASSSSKSSHSAGGSQDLLFINTCNHIHKTTQAKRMQGIKKVNHVDLEKVFDPFQNDRKRRRNVELPTMSPIETPSKLDLNDQQDVPRFSHQYHVCATSTSDHRHSIQSSDQKPRIQPVFEDGRNKENMHKPMEQDISESIMSNSAKKQSSVLKPFTKNDIYCTSTPYSTLSPMHDKFDVTSPLHNKFDVTSPLHVKFDALVGYDSFSKKQRFNNILTSQQKFFVDDGRNHKCESNLSMILNQTKNQVGSIYENHSQVPRPSTYQHYVPTSPDPYGMGDLERTNRYTDAYNTESFYPSDMRLSKRLTSPPKRKVQLPSSCVESSKWQTSSRSSDWRNFIFDSSQDNTVCERHEICDVELDTNKLKMNSMSEELMQQVLSLDEEIMSTYATQQTDDTALDKVFLNLSSTQSSHDYQHECFSVDNNQQLEQYVNNKLAKDETDVSSRISAEPKIVKGHNSTEDTGPQLSEPNLIQTTPNVTQTTPNVTQTTHNGAQTTHNVTQNAPNVTQNAPNVTQTTPNVTQNTPNVTQTTPNVIQITPNLNQTKYNLIQTKSNVTQTTPNGTKTTLNVTQTTLNGTKTTLNVTQTTPNLIQTTSNLNQTKSNLIQAKFNLIQSTHLQETNKSLKSSGTPQNALNDFTKQTVNVSRTSHGIDCTTQTTGIHCGTCKCLCTPGLEHTQKLQTLDGQGNQDDNHTDILIEKDVNKCDHQNIMTNESGVLEILKKSHLGLVGSNMDDNICQKIQCNERIRYSLRPRNVNK